MFRFDDLKPTDVESSDEQEDGAWQMQAGSRDMDGLELTIRIVGEDFDST